MKNIFLIIIFCLVLGFEAFSQTQREQEVIDEINLVRTNPQGYIQYIDPFLEYWGSGKEEIAAAEELKKELKNMKPLPAMEFSETLYTSSKKHGEYIRKTKRFEHSDCDCAENIQYGNSDIRYAVLDLLVDGGVASRGHRRNILSPSHKYVGVYEVLGSVEDMPFIFVQQFTSGE
jgi:uncharacterized protein YkwD